jgi:hypothetical protein
MQAYAWYVWWQKARSGPSLKIRIGVRPSSRQSPSRASKNVGKEEGEAPQAIANGSRRLQSKVGLQARGKKSGATRLACRGLGR